MNHEGETTMDTPINESEIQQQIQIEAVRHKTQLMRNNSGALEDKSGRLVRYGLGNVSKKHSDQIKSSDLIGFTQITITPAMVGKTIAVFTAVEVKRPDWKPSVKDKRYLAQNNFLNWLAKAGGFAFFANSVESFKSNIERYLWDLGS